MMGGQTGAGTMGAGPGVMGAGMMGVEQLAQVEALHDQMVASGVCDAAQMQSLHAQHHPGN